MNNIIELINKRNKEYKLLNMLDIKYIINELANTFELKIEKITEKKSKYAMSLSLKDLELVVDYEKLKINKNILSTNYLIFFAIVHELRHCCQLKQDFGKIGYIYQECFNYMNSSSFIKIAFYSLFHEYFPVEINADIVAYIYVLYVQKRLGDQIHYNIFKKMLLNLVNEAEIDKKYEVIACILGDDYLEMLNELDEYTLFINGLISDKDKNMKILDKILL